MDVQLKGPMTGVEATREIKQVSPATKVVIVSGSKTREALLVAAVEAGASGVVEKTEAVERLVEVTKAAAAGELLIDPAALPRVLQLVAKQRAVRTEVCLRVASLTRREREILQLVGEGLGNEGLAQRLHLSVRTVETHVQNVLRKLGVHSKLEAVALAARASGDIVTSR